MLSQSAVPAGLATQLLLANAANAINAMLYEKLDFNFIRASRRLRHQKHPPLSSQSIVSGQTAPELIAYAKANPGKITTGSPFSIRPAVAKLEELKQRNHQLEPGRAAQSARKNAERFKREIEFDRRRPANSLNKSSTQLWLILDP